MHPPAVGQVQESPDHADDFRLERRELRELERVERVAEQVAVVDLGQQRFEVLARSGIDQTEEATTVDRRFLRPPLVELNQDVGGGSALFDHLGSLAEHDSGRRVDTGSLVDPYTGL